jgi:hypothetical protein
MMGETRQARGGTWRKSTAPAKQCTLASAGLAAFCTTKREFLPTARRPQGRELL